MEDGSWRELASRFTIEFRAFAARPATKIKREFTVPVASPEARLRIVVCGAGQVVVSQVALSNGVEARKTQYFHQRKKIGRRVRKRGLPRLEVNLKTSVAVLRIG